MSDNDGKFTTNPGEFKKAKCGACGAQMKVKRNVFGPIQWGEAMGGGGHLHDSFRCPNCKEAWHKDIAELLEEIDNTISKTIRKIIRSDISQILKVKKGRRRQ